MLDSVFVCDWQSGNERAEADMRMVTPRCAPRPPAVPVPGPNVTPEPNEKIKVLAGNSTVPGAESKPEDTLRIRNTPWHCVTERPPAVPLPGPNVAPEPNEKIKVLAGNSILPSLCRAKRHS